MGEENKKSKQQYNIEKENENIINFLIEEIMNHSTDTKFLIDFIQKVREYRNKVYELKMNLGDGITEAYKVKKGKKLESLKDKIISCQNMQANCSIIDWFIDDDEIINICEKSICLGYYPIQTAVKELLKYKDKIFYEYHWLIDYDPTSIIKGMNKSFVENLFNFAGGVGKLNFEYLIQCATGKRVIKSEYGGDEERIRKIEKDTIEKVNILKSTQVFQYYENEVAFWQEMNLKKIREESTEEQCFE